MKKMFGFLVRGISAALSFFSIFIAIYDVHSEEALIFEDGSYTKMLIGAIIVGIGFALPGVIYEKESIPYAIKVLIHMGVGCTVFIIVGYVAGWIPRQNNSWECVKVILIEVFTAFFLWFCFSWHYKQETKK